MAKGYVYILTNPCFNAYFKSKIVKIGQAKDVTKRVATLNTSVPMRFDVYATLMTSKYKIVEKKIHQKLRGYSAIQELQGERRVKAENGEFYLITPAQAVKVLREESELIDESDKTWKFYGKHGQIVEGKFAIQDRESTKRGPFKFSDCGIKPGEKVCFKRDPSKLAIVVDDHHVRYGEEVTSLSALAKLLLNRHSCVQGPLHFTYNGEVLDELRKKMI